jgi:DNA-binding protein YbaB
MRNLKPNFVLYKYPDGLAQVMITGGANDVEVWFDRSAIPEAQAERYRLLVSSAYNLGVAHTKEKMLELIEK